MLTNGWCPCLMNSKETKYYAVLNTLSLGFDTTIFDYPMSRSSCDDRAESDRHGRSGEWAFGSRSSAWLSERERAQTRSRGR
jgi:hypothetical protein